MWGTAPPLKRKTQPRKKKGSCSGAFLPLTSPRVTTPALPPPIFPEQQSWFRLRKFLIRGFWISVCLCVATVLWLLWYVNTRGFVRKWRNVLVAEIAKSGVPVTIGRLTLNPWRGLAARNVRVMDAQAHGRTLAVIDEVVLDINYSNLVHHEPFINSIDLCSAALSLPLNPNDRKSECIDISGINARIVLPPHQLCVARAEADIHGLHVVASGRLMNPENLISRGDGKSSNKSAGLVINEALKTIDRLKLAGGKPVFELRIEGDSEKPGQIFAKGIFRAEKFTMGGTQTVKSMNITATFSEGVVRLEQCSASDACGLLDASGMFNPATGEAAFQVRSTLDLPGLARGAKLVKALDEITFISPPEVQLQGEVNLRAAQPGFHGKIMGHLASGRVTYKNTVFDGANTDFSWDGVQWYVRDARLKHPSGDLALNAMCMPGAFRFSVDSQVHPAAFLPFLPPETKELLSRIQLETSPHLQVEGRSPSLDFTSVELHGRIEVGAGRYRSATVKSASVPFSFKDNLLTCQDFKIERVEGSGSGTLTYDFKDDVLNFTHVHTTLVPMDITSTFDRELTQNLAPYRFKRRPALRLEGSIDCRKHRMNRNDITFNVEAAEGMNYVFAKRDLPFSKVKGVVTIKNDRIKLLGVEGSLFGGTVRADMDISLEKSKGDYTGRIRPENVDFPSVTKLYLAYDASTGRLSGTFDFSGKHDSTRAIKGAGHLRVTNGNVFAIPLFGPLSGIISGIVPGVGYNLAHLGTCSFTMEDGIIDTQDLNVAGKGFSMMGGGKLNLVDDRINFNIRLNAHGPAGVLLTPVSRLLEYTADNTLSNPNWHPKRLPKVLFTPRTESSPLAVREGTSKKAKKTGDKR